MIKKLLVKIIRSSNNELCETIIAEHLDATRKTTNLFRYTIEGSKIHELYTIPAEIDHWNIINGLITIYYKTGFEIEISRLVSA